MCVGYDDLHRVFVVERRPARDQKVEHGPDGINIAAGVGFAVADGLFRRHESGEPVIAPSCVSCAASTFITRLRQAEIEQLGHVESAAADRGEDIGGLDVAMHQAQIVRLGQRVARLPHQMNGPRRGHWPVAADQLRQVHARQKLHHVIKRAVLGRGRSRKYRRCSSGKAWPSPAPLAQSGPAPLGRPPFRGGSP